MTPADELPNEIQLRLEEALSKLAAEQRERKAVERELETLSRSIEAAARSEPITNPNLLRLLPYATRQLIATSFRYTPTNRSGRPSAYGDFMNRAIGEGLARYSSLMKTFAEFERDLVKIPAKTDLAAEPQWLNGWMPSYDAISIYGLLATKNPALYLEVGSGNSTKFARKAIRDHGLRTEIVSIDPHPRADINELCDTAIRQPLEECDHSVFTRLGLDDVLVVDNSHRAFQNSDVTVFFTEVFPFIQSGCTMGIHDIFLPYDYPEHFYSRFYNEQYLLAAYLLGAGDRISIILPNWFAKATAELSSIYDRIWSNEGMAAVPRNGCFFWLSWTEPPPAAQ